MCAGYIPSFFLRKGKILVHQVAVLTFFWGTQVSFFFFFVRKETKNV